jgi:hypothetical protein
MLPTFLLNWRLWAVAVVMCLGVFVGWKLNATMNPPPPPVTVTRTEVQEKVVNHTVTIIKKPDGTVTTTTSDETATKQSEAAVPTSVKIIQAKWSVATWATILDWKKWEKPEWSVMGYRRLGETNAWAGAGYDNGQKAVLIGVRVDF